MIDKKTDFYRYHNNFERYSTVKSILVSGNEEVLNTVSITIAIPTYNRPDLLKEAIDSSLNQHDFDDYCVLIVDNNPYRGCDTEKLIIEYDNSKIIYYKNQINIGMFGNHNRCFELSKSKWVTLLHDDDLLLPLHLKYCVEIINSTKDIDALQPGKLLWHDKNPLNISPGSFQAKKTKLRKIYDISNYNESRVGSLTGGVFRRDAFIRTGGYNPEFYPTSDFVFAVQFSNLFNLYVLNKKLVVYRISINESIKTETLALFLHNDFFLKSAIMSRYHIPKHIINVICSKSIEKSSISLQNEYNKNFLPDLENMPYYLKSNELVYQIFRIITSAYVKVLTNVILPIKRWGIWLYLSKKK